MSPKKEKVEMRGYHLTSLLISHNKTRANGKGSFRGHKGVALTQAHSYVHSCMVHVAYWNTET